MTVYYRPVKTPGGIDASHEFRTRLILSCDVKRWPGWTLEAMEPGMKVKVVVPEPEVSLQPVKD